MLSNEKIAPETYCFDPVIPIEGFSVLSMEKTVPETYCFVPVTVHAGFAVFNRDINGLDHHPTEIFGLGKLKGLRGSDL